MWTQQAKAVLEEYQARKAEEDALFEKYGLGNLRDRRDDFLLPIGEEVGNLLHDLIVATGARSIVEMGTSYGFSTLFLANAACKTDGKVHTFDIADYKQDYSRKRLERAGLAGQVEFHLGDALERLADFEGPIDFVLLDIWKEAYIPCFDLLYPKLADRAVIAADNMLYPETVIGLGRDYAAHVASHPDMHTALLGIGSGIELSSRWPEFAADG
jgi:predicted O-methyltransferase YrrM